MSCHCVVPVKNLPMNRPPPSEHSVDADAVNDDRLLADAPHWKHQDRCIRELHRDVLDAPLPAHLLQAVTQLQRQQQQHTLWARWGGMAASVLCAFALGWFGQALSQSPTFASNARQIPRDKAFALQAGVAHAVFSPEVRHPVEVGAAEQQHLVKWLSKRVGRELAVPDLSAQNFQLMGGRLLSGESGARAQFMFEDTMGKRITLYVGGLPPPDTANASLSTSFQFSQQGNNRSFYWVDHNFGYALTGELERPALMALAELVYAQLPRP
jgi:anti-sigma factor RsiW